MEIDEIKKKIKFAIDAVEGIDKDYKIEAFKIILQNSLAGIKKQAQNSGPNTNGSQEEENDVDETNPLVTLAKKVEINLQELKNVLDFEDNEFILLKKIEEQSDSQKQVLGCQIIITAFMKGKNLEWVKGSTLSEFIEKHSLGKPSNLSTNLMNSDLFRKKGKLKGTQYSLTTNGWQDGLKKIAELAKGN